MKLAIFVVSVLFLYNPVSAIAMEIKIGVLRIDYPALLPISRFDLKPDDLGFAGGVLANKDNQTTGAFLGIEFSVTYVTTSPEEVIIAFDTLLADKIDLIVLMAESDDLLKLADRVGDAALVVNAIARDTSLRDDQCRANVIHIAPSQAMIADAVTQFAMWKRWKRWFLIHGSNPKDHELRDAYRRSAKKFGARIVEEREFEDIGGSRRTDTGHVLVQRQIPVFTQNAKDHDVVIAADASNVFGLYLPFHTWNPRPVLGSGGLRPVTFHPSHEAWGATQYQRRFEKLSGRYLQEADYEVWLALRVIGEAVIRINSSSPEKLRDYILSDAFELAAFKGRKVTFRSWNGQMRQPVILTDSKITISVSPQEGYLHRRSALDTLGLDEPETACTEFKKRGDL
ncbi:MAG: ABC transporter substrate-binding protein [Hyphomicrobiales bacterium]|nr:ABC transporter substrate-binding protein [Hyphomicrobiales bacterium]